MLQQYVDELANAVIDELTPDAPMALDPLFEVADSLIDLSFALIPDMLPASIIGIVLIVAVVVILRKRRSGASYSHYEPSYEPFDGIITPEEFERIANKSARQIKRIKRVYVYGFNVSCTVVAQSGISEWEFELDFDDRASRNGSFTISSENKDSGIPNRLGSLMQEDIQAALKQARKDA